MSHDFAKGKGGKAGAGKKAGKKPAKKPAKKAAAVKKAPEKKGIPGWVWFLAGVVATVFVQIFYHLSQVDASKITVDDAPEGSPASIESSDDEKDFRPEFRFYDELKDRVVEVSEESVAEREQEDYSYALQAGSFKSADDAEQLRVEIILLNLEANVESRKNDSGTTWHRVIVGPFTSRSDLARARSILINNDIKTIKIKRS